MGFLALPDRLRFLSLGRSFYNQVCSAILDQPLKRVLFQTQMASLCWLGALPYAIKAALEGLARRRDGSETWPCVGQRRAFLVAAIWLYDSSIATNWWRGRGGCGFVAHHWLRRPAQNREIRQG
jgi:hypothetical protein